MLSRLLSFACLITCAAAAIALQGCSGRNGSGGTVMPTALDAPAAIRQTSAIGQAPSPPTVGKPPTLPPGLPVFGPLPGWMWSDVAESNCDDGSPSGFAYNPGTSGDLVVYFDAGGACWNATTCLVQNLASHGPIQRPQFTGWLGKLSGTILDRSLPNNPFANATLIFIPYCTGDLHAGSNVATYLDAKGVAHAYHHTGYLDSLAFLKRIASSWPVVRRLVVTGASAGGYGALLNYATYRARIIALDSYLIDDSGPPLPNGTLSASMSTGMFQNWKLGDVTDPLCDCRQGFEPAMATLVKRYPHDRMSLLESEQDAEISAYYGLSAAQFETDLNDTADTVFAGSPNARYFFVGGHTHMMLPAPSAFTEQQPLLTWLNEQITNAPTWHSEAP